MLGAFLEQHAHGLLDEQRIALGLVEQPRLYLLRDVVLCEQCVGELLALVTRQRLELDRRRTHASSAPARPHVQQFGPGQTEQEQRALAHPLCEVVDQLEQRFLGPVDVLEHHDQRLHVGELVRELARRPRDLRLTALSLDGFHHTGGEPEELGDRLVSAALDQLLLGRFHRVVVRDPRGGLDHLGERPVRDAFAVRKRAPGEDRRALDAGEELACEPALPHSRFAVDREDLRPPVPKRARIGVFEEVELRLAADERRRDGARLGRAVDRSKRAERDNRVAKAAQLEWARGLRLDASRREPVGSLSDENLSRRRRLLEAGRDVDRFAGGESRIGLVDDDLPGFDSDARLETEVGDVLEDPESGARRSIGVVFMCARNPEGGHDGVPGELLDRAAVPLDAAGNAVEEVRHAPARDLRVLGRQQLRRGDEVREQHCGELSLHGQILGTRPEVTAAKSSLKQTQSLVGRP